MPLTTSTGKPLTALRAGFVSCHRCAMLVRQPDESQLSSARCPRCGACLHLRKPNSVQRTWALVIAALIFYFPANLYPITETSYLGSVQSDTILSGVLYFMHSGSWGIALIIFVASIVVPIAKLTVLIGLLLSVHWRARWQPRQRSRLYQIVEVVGRWSMLDVFVVTILVALVRLGYLSTIVAGPGVIFFATVVVITMIAAMTFDPRLIWDVLEDDNERADFRDR